MKAFLSEVELFQGLSEHELQAMARASREQTFAKGTTLYREGERADSVWVVREGRIHLTRFHDGGHAVTTCVMSPGEVFCCLPALDHEKYPTDAIAAVDSSVVRIPMSAFTDLMDRLPAFRQEATCMFCGRLREMESKGCGVHDPVEKRLAQLLIVLQRKFGDTIPLTKQELADASGTTVETAIRVLARFKDEGIVSSARGKTILRDLDKLRHLAD